MIGRLPAKHPWDIVAALARGRILCGVGLTTDLSIAGLAIGSGGANNGIAKLGIIIGSLASAIAGYLVLAGARR
jgi:NhaA family Na+:H+ antiporter